MIEVCFYGRTLIKEFFIAGSTMVTGDNSTSITGYKGVSISGVSGISKSRAYGTAISGDYGTSLLSYNIGGKVSSGKDGTLQIAYLDGELNKIKLGYIGEDGLEPNVLYTLDENFDWIKTI